MIGNYFWGGAAAPYEIEQSLRFDGAASLTRTQATPTNGNIVTVSAWIKKSSMTLDYQGWMGADAGTSTSGAELKFGAAANSQIELYNELTNGSRGVGFTSHGSYRDPSAWMHVVSVYQNSSTPADSPTYVNGVQITGTSSSGGSSPGAGWGDAAPQWNMSGVIQSVGSCTTTTYRLRYLDGYLAEVIQVDGQALDQYDFGEFDDNGVWRPIEYTGTYGNNGFYLKFDPSATNGVGHDHSGNGNHFTASGITTSGTGTDVMSDTPTNNWCTLNAVDNLSGATLTNGNLETTSAAANYKSNFGTIFASSGKWYAEFTVLAGSNETRMIPGVGTKQTSVTSNLGSDAYAYSLNYSGTTIYKRTNNVNTALSSTDTLTTNSVVMVALDLDNNKLWFGQDGTWFDSGAPASGTNEIFTITAGEYTFMPCTFSDGKFAVNFGQRDFEYTPPTGFNALNTSNLPAPDIADGSDYFQTVLYTGNATARSITVEDNSQNAWQPDLTWIKCRSVGTDNVLTDAVRGATKVIRSNITNSEYTQSDSLTAFTSTGFNLGDDNDGGVSGNFNVNGRTYVAWNWLAGNGTSSISTGSIDGTNPTIASTVSVNQTAGFSIVSYNAGLTSSGTKTIAHGLGVPPKLIIGKNRGSAAWRIRPFFLNNNAYDFLEFDDGALAQLSSSDGTMSLPTNTTFDVNWNTSVGASGDIIAYCFAEVEGYSKFGSYTGNGSTDGPFVYCGFKPAWVMIKRTSSTGSWYIGDNTRNTYNVMNARLLANSSNAESSTLAFWDFTSNGFKLRTNSSEYNSSGQTFVFMAFASSPFGGSGVSPATAR